MAANTHTVKLSDGRVVCLSYGVPVAVFLPAYHALATNTLQGCIKTAERYSVTTSKHANAFCRAQGSEGHEVPTEVFTTLIAPVIGGGQ